MDSLSADFPADDFDEVLDEGIYVEPKDRDPRSEDARQAEFVVLMRKTARACRLYAVPNGTYIASFAGRQKRQREGMNSGEPDVGISWADAVTARIEFKNGTKMPDENQITALNWYHRRNHPVAVCRTAEGAMRWLASLGAPVRVPR